MKKNIVDALNDGLPEIAEKTENMFITSEYAKAADLSVGSARDRLNKLLEAGTVRKVVFYTKLKNGMKQRLSGWEYIGAGR